MDGVLLVDKPSGPTSHDVVQRLRRSTRESRIGHTGTLDPRATGLLLIVIGRATRLASRLSAHRKTYDADIRLGFPTDTDDADGEAIADEILPPADLSVILAALPAFVGEIDQVPPQHSAKKIGGERAYALARSDRRVPLAPVRVTVFAVDPIESSAWTPGRIRVRVTASSGFYVRALARDLGSALGCGGHLTELRRTSVGRFDLAQAMPLDQAEALGPVLGDRLVTMSDALPEAPAVWLTAEGLVRVKHGNPVGPEAVAAGGWPLAGAGDVRLLDDAGTLIAVAQPRGGALHPVVVVG
jgi:tRNA pseudouridine55 synthase